MFLTLEEEATAALSARDWRTLSPTLRRFLSAYEHRRHYFFLSPKQLESVHSHCDLNDGDRRLLSSFESKLLETAALFKRSLFRLVVDPRVNIQSIDVGPPYIVRMNPALFDQFDVVGRSGLYAEDVANDSEWYLFLSDVLAEAIELPGVRCALEPSHAGGGGLIGHFPRFVQGRSRGLCLLDRDSHGPWEQVGPHASDIRRRAVRSHVLALGDEDFSSIVPFVGISTTSFRNVSNSIPPKLVEYFYSHWDRKPDQLAIFSGCFPTFPILTPPEWRLWLGLNFETPGARAAIEHAFDGRVTPRVLTRYLAAVDRSGPPRIPKGVTGRILLELERVPRSRQIAEAIVLDAMDVEEYRSAMTMMIAPMTHLGASIRHAVI